MHRSATGLAGCKAGTQASIRARRCGGSALYFRSTIEAIANAKLRRMQRELELRGIRPGRLGDD
jgi:hypothetical protein